MVKFKKILEESLSEEKIENFRKDCQYFIKQNYDELDKSLGIVRGTKDHGNLKKRSFRKRKKIKGIPFKFYFHEKLRPKNIPSRTEIVSSYKGKLDYEHLEHYGEKSYMVFPIGSQYKLVWHPKVEDFNDTRYWDLYRPIRVRVNSILNIHGTERIKLDGKNISIPDEFIKYANIEKHLDINYDQINKPEDIIRSYRKIINYLEKNKEVLEPVFEKIDNLLGSANPYEFFQDARKEMKRYFGEVNITQKIHNIPVTNSEVSVYPPDGFWYIDKKVVDYVNDNYNTWKELV